MEAETEDSEPAAETETAADAEAGTEEHFLEPADGTDGLDTADFASMRLVVLASDAGMIVDPEHVIANYDTIYLLQYGSAEQAMNAYVYYRANADAVEPDAVVTMASELLSDEGIDMDVTEEQNPILALSEEDDSDAAQKADRVIALIDTGASEGPNVIDRISLIDDVVSGDNPHADEMVAAIVSQNPDAEILSIRAMDDYGYGTISSIVAAMEYAINQDVAIINLSLYARTTLLNSVLEAEIQKATDAGILVVAAAGNDGADVADYMPGSVEAAWIIGACDETGARLAYSNYGDTVDYYVTAESTSVASALFSGYVSKNGIDAVAEVLNQGMIFEPNYLSGGLDKVDYGAEAIEQEFADYAVDNAIIAVTKYTFVYADNVADGESLDSLYHDGDERMMDAMIGTIDATPEVYVVGDGTYKFRANFPVINGYASCADYLDVVFANGNNNGEQITEGVSFDKETCIATVTEEALEMAEGDFANIQCQVLVAVDDVPSYIIQNVTVENADGTVYDTTVRIRSGLGLEYIELAAEGAEEELEASDFTVYVNGERTAVPVECLEYDAETHSLIVLSWYAAFVNSMRIVIHKETEAVFKVAASGQSIIEGIGQVTTYRNSAANFYLANGTDVSGLYVGRYTGTTARIGSNLYYGMDVGNNLPTAAYSFPVNDQTSGSFYMYFPKDVFGINFQYYDANGNSYGSAGFSGYDYNVGIQGRCVHTTDAYGPAAEKLYYFKIIDKWTNGEYTYFAMAFIGSTSLTGTASSSTTTQNTGGVIVFGVKSTVTASVNKVWDDDNDALGLRPSAITMQLQVKNVDEDESHWNAVDPQWVGASSGTVTLNAANNWSASITGLRQYNTDGVTLLVYRFVEASVPSGYTETVGDPTWNSTTLLHSNTVTNSIQKGSAKLQKVSADISVTNGNSAYSLEGAVYGVYKTTADANADTNRVTTMTTKSDGSTDVVELQVGTYYIKEISASMGYLLDTSVHAVTIVANTTSTVTSTEPVGYDSTIYIEKYPNVDDSYTEELPSLEGTQFTIKFYAGYYTESTLPGTATRTWVIQTKYDSTTGKYVAALDSAHLVSGTLYKDANGNAVLPFGTIVIEETKAASGYALDYYITENNFGKTVATGSKAYLMLIGVNCYQGIDYSLVYNFNYYISKWSDIRSLYSTSPYDAIKHFVEFGMDEGRQGIVSFDVTTYKAKNSDLVTAFGSDLAQYYLHYIEYGYKEGRTAVSGDSSGTNTLSVYDTLSYGYLYLQKESALPDITDGNDCYSLAGAVYGVYGTAKDALADTNREATLTTDATGLSNTVELLMGTYYVKEVTASQGYELDENVYTATIQPLQTSTITSNGEDTVSVEYPGNDPMGIQITKIWDGDETPTIPSLEGTQFTVKYYDGYYTESTLPDEATRIWVIEAKYNKVTGTYAAYLTSTYLVSSLSDDLYYANGYPTLPLGTVTVQETKPAAGYTLKGYLKDKKGTTIATDSELYISQVKQGENTSALSGGNEYTASDTPIFGSIKIKKYDTDGKTALQGVTFEIANSAGETIATKTTDANGEILFDDLYPDAYTITETATVSGHMLLKDPITAEIPMRVTEQEIQDNNIDKNQCIYDEADDIYYIYNLTYEISNSVTFTYPMTGGMTTAWTYLPLIAGLMVLAGMSVIVLRRKRRG